MNAHKTRLITLTVFWLAAFFALSPSLAEPTPERLLSLVPLELESDRKVPTGPLGSEHNPFKLIDLIRKPEMIKPGVFVANPKSEDEDIMILPSKENGKFSAADKWKHTKSMLSLAGWKIPSKLHEQSKAINVNSIRVTGVASTYGRNDGFAGQLTSAGTIVDTSTAALQMDLAHVLSDMGAVPFSMRGVKAVLTMPNGTRVNKYLEDKGGLVNYLGEGYWRQAISTMKVDGNGVGTLAPLPASHYRVVDIFTQARSTLIPNVTVEIFLKRPIVRRTEFSPSQRQAWMQKNFEEPKVKS